MNITSIITTAFATVTLLGLSSSVVIAGDKADSNPRGADIGPDVITLFVGEDGYGGGGTDIEYYGSSSGIGGWAIGTTACNIGDQVADWYGGTNDVPVIAQAVYRLKEGRFEQISTAWLKHSFCAVSEPGCEHFGGNCQGTGCQTLGIMCGDTYWAGLNADVDAPRSEINAFTGYYDYPFTISPTGPSAIRGRLQINSTDIDPTLNPNAEYFIEGQYVSTDDPLWNNQFNNASYRHVDFTSTTTCVGLSPTVQELAAIYAWQALDNDVDIQEIIIPGEGLVHLASRVYDNEDGTWRYEYAIHNQNSARSIKSFEIPLSACVTLSNVGFHDIDYHSGEIFDNSDWSISQSSTGITWSSDSYDSNRWANAIRWGSTYNFYFTADQPPSDTDLTLVTFTTDNAIETIAAAPMCISSCVGDSNGDGAVNVTDLLTLIADWDSNSPQSDLNEDGTVNVTDLLILIADWGCE